jgi:hypothetical protein
MIFQVMDRAELQPDFDESMLFEDIESGQQLEVSPDYLRTTYRERIKAHLEHMQKVAGRLGADHILLTTDEPLDRALRGYLMFRNSHRR